MTNSRSQAPNAPSPFDPTFDDQTPFIQTMRALGFTANLKGVCFGLSHSARDTYQAGSYQAFIQDMNEINSLYEICETELITHIHKMKSSASIELVKLIDELKTSTDLTVEQRKQKLKECNDHLQLQKEAHRYLKEHDDGVESSELTKQIREEFAKKIDLVMQAKVSLLKDLISILKKTGNVKYIDLQNELKNLSSLSYNEKEQKIEDLLQNLSNNSKVLKKIIGIELQSKLKRIPKEKLDFLNKTKALFTRIELYQQPHLYPGYFNEKMVTDQTENTKLVYPLVESEQLRKQGGLDDIILFRGCYTPTNLVTYFQTLKESLSAFNHPVSLNLGSVNHSIMIGYDPKSQLFSFFDPSQKPIEIREVTEISKQVFSALSKRRIYVLSEKPDSNEVKKYNRNYIVIRTPPGIFHVDIKGKSHELKIDNIAAFNAALNEFDNEPTKLDEEGNGFKNIIKLNIGHEDLGSSVAIFDTEISSLKKHRDEKFVDEIRIWYKEKLKPAHQVTPEKLRPDANGINLFEFSIYYNDIELTQKCIENGSKPTFKHLALAFKKNNDEMAAILMPHIKSPLVTAVSLNDIKTIKKLIEKKADLNQENGALTALTTAVVMDNVEIINILLENGADPDYASPGTQITSRMMADLDGHTDVVNIFKEHDLQKRNSRTNIEKSPTPQPTQIRSPNLTENNPQVNTKVIPQKKYIAPRREIEKLSTMQPTLGQSQNLTEKEITTKRKVGR